MIKKWELLDSKPVFESDFITLYREKLQKADGGIVDDYYSVKRRDVVYIAALTEKKEVPLVYQYKNGLKELIWELPAGFVDKGEDSQEAASRELLEETGFRAKNWLYLGGYSANAGSSGNKNHFFLATSASKVTEQKLDKNEEIEVKLFDFSQLVNEIKARKSLLVDSQSQLALLLSWEELSK